MRIGILGDRQDSGRPQLDIRQGTCRRAQPAKAPAAKPDVHTLEQAAAPPPIRHLPASTHMYRHIHRHCGLMSKAKLVADGQREEKLAAVDERGDEDEEEGRRTDPCTQRGAEERLGSPRPARD